MIGKFTISAFTASPGRLPLGMTSPIQRWRRPPDWRDSGSRCFHAAAQGCRGGPDPVTAGPGSKRRAFVGCREDLADFGSWVFRNLDRLQYRLADKGTPAVRPVRKAAGLLEMAWLPHRVRRMDAGIHPQTPEETFMRANRLIPIAGLAFAVACSDAATSPHRHPVMPPMGDRSAQATTCCCR